MPERWLFPEFRDEFEFTRYPFADSASLTADTGQQLTVDLFLDAALYPVGGGSRVGISQIDISPGSATITISDTTQKPLGTVTFNTLQPPDTLVLTDAAGRPAGILVSESLRLTQLGTWSIGTHRFSVGAAEFVASVVTPTPQIGVEGIQLPDGTLLTGEVWLVAENGVMFTQSDSQEIRISTVGDPLFLRARCEAAEQFAAPNFIRTINHCHPDKFGNYNIVVGDSDTENTILRIYAEEDALVIDAVGDTIS